MNYEKYLERLYDKIIFEPLEKTINDEDPKTILMCISKNMENIIKKSKEDIDASVYDYLIAKYFEEIWISELMPPYTIGKETEEIVFFMMDNNINMINNLKVNEQKELKNLLESIKYLFGDDLKNPNKEELNISLIKKVHYVLMNDLLPKEQTGIFRKIFVRPSNSSLDSYCSPNKIEKRLNTLINFCDNKLKKNSNIETIIKLGTLFFSEFLLIHPFRDGNGRCARLLLNNLLKDHILIPFSLYYQNRELYINVLENRNVYFTPPNNLAYYILRCIKKTLNTAEYLLMD